MQSSGHSVKRIASHIEWAITIGNNDKLQTHLDEMIIMCNKIKSEMEEQKDIGKNIEVEIINEIDFLYKPILKKDYYEGTYLEEFSEKRSEDLKLSNAITNHNKFWQSYEIIKGNIFGSMPKELLTDKGVMDLERSGWDQCKVEVIDILQRHCEFKELVEFCDVKYGKYVIVKEKSSDMEMVLHYMID